MFAHSTLTARHPLSLWVLRLFGYDGVLPVVVLLVPALLTLMLGRGVLIETAAVILPIGAFLIRAGLGLKIIDENACTQPFKRVQCVLLFLGLIALLLVDSFVILSWSLPANALGRRDYEITAIIYSFYLAMMAIASFPGFADRQDRDPSERT